MKCFQPSISIKKTVFPTTKVEVNKPDVYNCVWYLIGEMQRRTQTSLVTEDVIINLSPVFKRLEFCMVIKRFVLNIILLKNNFRVVV